MVNQFHTPGLIISGRKTELKAKPIIRASDIQEIYDSRRLKLSDLVVEVDTRRLFSFKRRK